MAGIDRMISSSLTSQIKKNLDLDILKKVERELFLEHGMSIKISIEHFHVFLKVLKKNLNIDVNKFENECIKKIIKIKKNDEKYIITILDQDLKNLILEIFGEIESRKIIFCLFDNEYTIPHILKESKVPKTSGYRKIENWILNGLIVESQKVLSESKKVSKIQCIFQEISLDIKKGKFLVNVTIDKKIFEKSTSMKSILE